VRIQSAERARQAEHHSTLIRLPYSTKETSIPKMTCPLLDSVLNSFYVQLTTSNEHSEVTGVNLDKSSRVLSSGYATPTSAHPSICIRSLRWKISEEEEHGRRWPRYRLIGRDEDTQARLLATRVLTISLRTGAAQAYGSDL